MDEPNLQTIPKPKDFSFKLSQPGSDPEGTTHAMQTVALRTAFAAPPGHVLLSADYKQMEYRIMAHFR